MPLPFERFSAQRSSGACSLKRELVNVIKEPIRDALVQGKCAGGRIWALNSIDV